MDKLLIQRHLSRRDADDNRDAAEGVAEALRALGHEAHVVYDGEAAIEAARRLAPDLALVDIGLPVVDGYEVARRLRAMPEGRRLGLVAMTGYGQPSDRQRATAAGFDDHIVKPVSIDVVEASVRAAEGARSRAAGVEQPA
ncbi:response regulator [Sorangium sp. So ce1128]